MKIWDKFFALFKKGNKERSEKDAAKLIAAPEVKYESTRGVWAPSDPKYDTINMVSHYLSTLGFDDFEARTSGETSSHHWTFAFTHTYKSMEDFLLNSHNDYDIESEDNRSGPASDWDSTFFTVIKHDEAGDITMLMIIHENDYLGIKAPPVEVKWILTYPIELKDSELINTIISKVSNL